MPKESGFNRENLVEIIKQKLLLVLISGGLNIEKRYRHRYV